MSAKLLQLNFRFSTTADEYEEAVSALAEDFAAVPGLRWKVWLMNESESEAGGIYLFKSELAAMVLAHPALSEFSAKPFDVMDGLTAITRGPVQEAVEA